MGYIDKYEINDVNTNYILILLLFIYKVGFDILYGRQLVYGILYMFTVDIDCFSNTMYVYIK